MRVGVFKRGGAFIFDAMPIFLILSLLFSLFVGDILKPEGYDVGMEEYEVIREQYNDLIEPLTAQNEAGTLSDADYQEELDNLSSSFTEDTKTYTIMMMNFLIDSIFYYVLSYTILYYAYNVLTKGKTFGRKFMKIELQGKINWWTLLVREVIWKTGFWILTLAIGGILIDIIMVSFTNKKRTLRDMVSGITVAVEGVTYPF